MSVLQLDGEHLTIDKIKDFLGNSESTIEITADAYKRVDASRRVVENIIAEEKTIYGITTGFGLFCDVLISKEKVEDLQINLIRSHACGVGKPFGEPEALLMMVFRLNTMLKGHSGVTRGLVEQLKLYINKRIIPVVPEQGSLGASGDLAPLSHMALTLIGEGEVFFMGERKNTRDVLESLGIESITLQAKEGLALINGTQPMTAQGVVNYIEADKLMHDSLWIASLTHQALNGITDAYNHQIHESRGYPEQIYVAEKMLEYLEGSKLTTRQGELRVQDGYSIRCIPQVHGASLQTLKYVKEKLEIEMNAANDNPLIFSEDEVYSGGNFHGQPIAIAMDLLKIGVAEIANITERRIERLVNPALNGDLPAFLSPEDGLQSGAMILQYSAASLVSENKTLAHPASVDSIPSSANQEDHVSMGTIGARHARDIINNTRFVIATEMFIAMTAAEIKGKDKLSPATRKKFDEFRLIADFIDHDRNFSIEINELANALTEVN
ncbi:Histidine ammonia-lyase [Jeotgalicoccus aerolatus]|uniref:Histidine ammonia-lyase n=1 Tax=Jeotgalicoccus aerolatus TaxID=709510 RepID=A0ABS4HQ57_9STAP|nr:histidine ammonia-lyase [Jeotgalicoccus aerolatus]MBP1953067.1 histidine ammonia-lyase [Jeotgalicoccus aerolatus]GGE02187.1 histidine ammonia-lyase [Jeotgalicoccus aerolatus]CAD2073059.1 Histidine ammonia-lyase [Jeotgalicoccus aerolatus]